MKSNIINHRLEIMESKSNIRGEDLTAPFAIKFSGVDFLIEKEQDYYLPIKRKLKESLIKIPYEEKFVTRQKFAKYLMDLKLRKIQGFLYNKYEENIDEIKKDTTTLLLNLDRIVCISLNQEIQELLIDKKEINTFAFDFIFPNGITHTFCINKTEWYQWRANNIV